MITTENGLRLIPRDCPLCGKAPYTIVGHGYDYELRSSNYVYEFRRCRLCGIQFPHRVPVLEDLHKIYDLEMFWTRDRFIYNHTLMLQLRFRNARLIKRLRRLARKNPTFSILDIGSGEGKLFRLLKKEFPKARFHSLDAVYTQDEIASGLDCQEVTHFNTAFEDFNPDGRSFDVITSQHNIEHVHDPAAYLEKISDLLSDNGFAFVETPNVDALEFRLMQKKLYCGGYSIPRHFTLFTEAAFKHLVSRTRGLEIEKVHHFMAIYHWIGMLHNWHYDKFRSERSDKIFNYNNLFFSGPLYLIDILRWLVGCKTGTFEFFLVKKGNRSQCR